MKDDLFESIPPRGRGEETAENRRIHEIADELRRRCQLYEAQLRGSQEHVSHLLTEQRVAEQYAKENNLWLPLSSVFDLGVPGPSGHENDTFVSNDIIYKMNNLLNSGSILRLFEKVAMHNDLFYDTAYAFHSFTGFDGRNVMPIFQQRLVKDARPAMKIEIDTYMAALGFHKVNNEGRYSNYRYEVWDLLPRNVLRDAEGDLFVVDAEIKLINGSTEY